MSSPRWRTRSPRPSGSAPPEFTAERDGHASVGTLETRRNRHRHNQPDTARPRLGPALTSARLPRCGIHPDGGRLHANRHRQGQEWRPALSPISLRRNRLSARCCPTGQPDLTKRAAVTLNYGLAPEVAAASWRRRCWIARSSAVAAARSARTVSSRRSLRAGEPGGAMLRSRASARSVSPGGDGRGTTIRAFRAELPPPCQPVWSGG
jgi:hypothetical protein